MRIPFALSLACVAVVAAGAAAVSLSSRAYGEDAAADPSAAKIALLEARVEALKADVDFLRAREHAVTNAVMSLGKLGGDLHAGTAQARVAGFTLAAIPEASRTALLVALESFSANLSSGGPAPSAAEIDLLRRADALRAKAFAK